jgi:glycine/D-amino acid oxidase-like deaminating enzyme
MTTPPWQQIPSSCTSDVTTDVLVVGGGFVGLSVAFWLSEFRTDLNITIIDQNRCGSGASGRNAGFLTMGSASFYKGLFESWGMDGAQAINRFARQSLELLLKNILEPNSELQFEKTSSLTLFQNLTQRLSWNEKNFDASKFDFHWLDHSDMPKGIAGRFHGAYETGPEYKANPIELLGVIRKILTGRKVRIIENSSAFEIYDEGVKTETNTIKTKQVILALNGYFPQFHGAFKNVIRPCRAQMLAVEIEGGFDCSHLYYDPPERVYWRLTQEKVLVIGGKRLLDEAAEEGDFDKLSPVIQRGLEDYLKIQLGVRYKVLNRWSGIMGFTSHELPYVEQVKAPLETFIIGGFSGHGLGLGFHSAKDLAELVVGMKKESFFSQFKKGDFVI